MKSENNKHLYLQNTNIRKNFIFHKILPLYIDNLHIDKFTNKLTIILFNRPKRIRMTKKIFKRLEILIKF